MIQHTHKELAALVRKAQAKDSNAFAQLYEATYQQLYYYVLSMVHSEQDAEDLVQSTYVIVLKKLDTLKEGSTFVAWLNHIAYHECMHLLGARKKAPAGEAYDGEAANLPDPSEANDPLAQSVKSDRDRRVMAALDSLPPEYKTVLLMQYYNNMKLADIAIVLDCPLGTVKSRANAAKQQLKKALAGQEELRLNMGFPILGLSGALRHSAAQISMPADAAQQSLQNVLTEAGFSPEVTFTPQPNAAPATPRLNPAAAGAGVTAAAVAAVSTAFWLMPPVLGPVDYDKAPALQTTLTVPAENVAVNGGVMVTLPNGTRCEAEKLGEGAYALVAEENGSYLVEAIGRSGKSVQRTVLINTLDHEAPTVTNFELSGDTLTLQMTDDLAGIDYTSVRADGNGASTLPTTVDAAGGTVQFHVEENDFYVTVADVLGNEGTYRVTVALK